MRFRNALSALLLLCLGLAAHAQIVVGGGFFGDYDLRTNQQSGLLQVQPAPGSSNAFTGTVFGSPIAGYFASVRREAVWVESVGGQPARAYVASTSRSSMNGVTYALNSQFGASVTRNSFTFAAAARGGVGQFGPVRPLAEPAVPGPAAALPSSVAWLTANGSTSPLVLNIDAAGNVTGVAFQDEVRGHYAASAGVLAFVRMRGGVPFQFFHGNLTPGIAGAQPSLAGSFYPLSEAAGASPSAIRFTMAAPAGQGFLTFVSRGVAALCLTIENGSRAAGAPLLLAPCGAAGQAMTLIAGADGFRRMVLRDSGMCLDVANASVAAGARVQQFNCHGGLNQRLHYLAVSNNVADFQMRFAHSSLCMTMGAPLVNGLVLPLVEQASCNPVGPHNTFIAAW